LLSAIGLGSLLVDKSAVFLENTFSALSSASLGVFRFPSA
jgi:hypothetical protein